jgi:hypothetical protein
MSNYLYTLVARNFNLLETAQPRVASLFEPPRNFAPVDALEARPLKRHAIVDRPAFVPAPPTDATDVSTAQPKTLQRGAPPPASIQAHVKLSDPLPEEALGQTTKARQASPPPSEIKTHIERATTSETLRPSLHRASLPHGQVVPALPSSSPADAILGASDAATHKSLPVRAARASERKAFESSARDEENHPQAPTKKALRAEVTDLIDKSTRRDASIEAQPTRLDRIVERIFDRHPASRENQQSVSPSKTEPSVREPLAQPDPPAIIVQPQVSRSVYTERADPFSSTRAAEPEQIVHVTIGRVEVRATPQPQARAQQKSAHAPTESLEEYLRQRAQGGGSR